MLYCTASEHTQCVCVYVCSAAADGAPGERPRPAVYSPVASAGRGEGLVLRQRGQRLEVRGVGDAHVCAVRGDGAGAERLRARPRTRRCDRALRRGL